MFSLCQSCSVSSPINSIIDLHPSPALCALLSLVSLHAISKFQDAVVVGLHTCGNLAPSTLRMFAAKAELAAVCSVGCCYHLLSEEFDPAMKGNHTQTHTHTSHFFLGGGYACGLCCKWSPWPLSLFPPHTACYPTSDTCTAHGITTICVTMFRTSPHIYIL